jgi:hypothetical protein
MYEIREKTSQSHQDGNLPAAEDRVSQTLSGSVPQPSGLHHVL